MRFRALLALWLVVYLPVAEAATVGSGAPDTSITLDFTYAWGRGNFRNLVSDPSDNVTKFGSTGLIQHFPSVSNSAITLALVKPDSTDAANVVQVLDPMYAYYSTLAVGTVGYPTDDTSICPVLKSSGNTLDTCQWQGFTNNYVLFSYSLPVYTGGQNFATRDPFYTKWVAFYGINGLGPAISAETTATSPYGSTSTFQIFDQGAIYNITAGLIAGRLLAVKEPVYDLYAAQGAQAGSLGLPTSEELALPNGLIQQNFEGGAIQYDPATRVPVLLPAVSSVVISPTGPLQLNAGDTATLTATLYAANQTTLTNRTVVWNTSNGQVVQVAGNGLTATLKAVGGGTASITASSGGKTSAALIVTVIAPCCQIGEGAPGAVQQAFVTAVTRNKLTVQIPAASPAVRIGAGYAQQLTGSGANYLVTVADGSSSGYVVSGSLLSAYTASGGPAGSLGYPTSDATAGGRQNFKNGSLAGNPVVLVSGAILAKWASLGYETGLAGSPAGAAAAFQTFTGTSGLAQNFQNAIIVNPTAGKFAGQAFAVSGTILSIYNAHGGPSGDLGSPTGSEQAQQQSFEGGTVDYSSGTAVVTAAPRTPSITATPASVVTGTPVHLILGGFANGATIRVSVTGQPDFLVNVTTGAYVWDSLAGAAGNVTVKAVDTSSGATATATFTVKTAAAAGLALSVVSGDQQTGAPGAALASMLTVVVKDSSGNPVSGQTVTFAASPGGTISPTTAVTGANGQASASWRMPLQEDVALATATLSKSVVTFSAKAAAFSLTNFPVLSQNVQGTLGNGPDLISQKGALLTAAASILRYHQLRGEMPQPNGLADPVVLNQFLKNFCAGTVCDGFVSFGSSTEQTVNLWRLGAFAGGAVDVQVKTNYGHDGPVATMNAIRDLVSSGAPVLVDLWLYQPTSTVLGNVPYGSHFVVATGVASDGSILISDPTGQATNLNSYVTGLTSNGVSLQALPRATVRLAPQVPSSPGFLLAGNTNVGGTSVAGACPPGLSLPGPAATFPNPPQTNAPGVGFQKCDGARDTYEIDIQQAGTGLAATFTDLANPVQVMLDPATGSYLATRNGTSWNVAPITTNISTGGIINPASLTPQVAPGGFMSIYGTGFAASTVQVNNETAGIVATLPFLINAVVPLDIVPGSATVAVTTPRGNAQQTVSISAVAPAIFSVGNNQAAITNQDASLNTPANPAPRGSTLVIYGTGFGAVTTANGLSRAAVPVSAVINGIEIPAAFAGLTPGVPGLYQANIPLPATLAPGLALQLYLKQGSAVSNTVTVAVQ